MYFKRISMHGFKSFADPTVINLDLGITAIVGPNGCGKSNILDALRWGLGEQSARELRGSHMQDVIFNGSGGRPATGMAEVSLTFDNSDGQLPIDYNEVEVTRRVYRSGESEYLLNQTACRLRDIQELFMDTGIGTNAYSLIGQGKIDLVLSTKPEDRRYLLEEAAGIIKYKARKRMAMRKLDTAEQNMLRLNDIIAEVDRQMRSLKRQVNAAIRHRELTTELRSLEIRNAWLKYNDLSGQVDDLRTQLSESVDHYQELTVKTSSQEAELERINLKRVEIDRLLSERRDREHQSASEMERLEGQISLFKKEIEFAQERATAAALEKEHLEKESAEMDSESGVSAEQLAQSEKEAKAVGDTLAALQEEADKTQRLLQEKEKEIGELRGLSVESANTRNRIQTEIETVGVTIANLDTQMKTLREQQQGLHKRIQETGVQVDQLTQTEEELKTTFASTVKQREETIVARKELEKEIVTLNTRWQELRESRSSLEARLTSLVELRDSYEGFAVGVRAIMMARQKQYPGIQGIIGPVGDVISTEKRYEYAIEAALGGNINNIIVDRAEDAKAAINFLKEKRAGRVTFLPLDTIRPGFPDDGKSLKHQKGIIGLAVDYVQCESNLMPAVQYLLYNTLIVESIDDAIRIAREESRFPRLVTLEGEVVTPAGAVTGGRTQRESQGLLRRSSEIEELTQKVKQIEETLDTMTARAKQLSDRSATLGENIRAFESEEHRFRQQLSETGVALARRTAEADSQRSALTEIDTTLLGLDKQKSALQERLEEIHSRKGGMETDDETLQKRLETAQRDAAQQRAELDSFNNTIADKRVQENGLLRALEELKRDYERSRKSSRDMQEQAQKQEALKKEMETRAHDFEEQIKAIVSQSAQISLTRDTLHKEVLETQKEQAFLIESNDKLTQQLKESRVKMEAAQRGVHKLELECSQKEDRMEFFQERISMEYGLALASLTDDDVGSDEYDEEERDKLIEQKRQALQRLGSVNLGAIEEYDVLEKRAQFLKTQNNDLVQARDTLLGVVKKIDATTEDLFQTTFNAISDNFKHYFRRLFNGGQARLFLLDEANPLESGIEIEARPPGKKPQTIKLLSGGEQALTAIALLFSIFVAKPSPFCVLDEVDAPLDDINVTRFLTMVDEFTAKSQFIMITHNKKTMAHSDAIFGVTQQEPGVSQLVSVRLEEAEKVASNS
ncbi:MAG: chromosome segregation protein SMC [Candidatus Hydrogenedentales bacterium]